MKNRRPSCRSPSTPIIHRFLTLKRSLGRLYDREGRVLEALDTFLTTAGDRPVDLTRDTFARWCRTQAHLTPGVRHFRMSLVRALCLYRRRTEPGCYVPDLVLLPTPHQAAAPYILSEEEVSRLLQATGALKPIPFSPLLPQVYRTAIVLLYTTGLRRGELLRLTIGDYDSAERTLMVRATKFFKERLLPLSPDGSAAIDDILRERRHRHLPAASETPLLGAAHSGERPYKAGGLFVGLKKLFERANVRKPNGRTPRVHDFRHTFAVHALLRWYRSGEELQSKLPLLSTYLGHGSIASTQHYLGFVPPLGALASKRFAERCSLLVTGLADQSGGEE